LRDFPQDVVPERGALVEAVGLQILELGGRQSLLGFQSTGGITSWLPIFLFVVLFGLSME
jgi:hypothetical protein